MVQEQNSKEYNQVRRYHNSYDNIITWKIAQHDSLFSIVYTPGVMLLVLPIWWIAIFIFCFFFYKYAGPPFDVLSIVIGVSTGAIQGVITWFRLSKEKVKGDYLYLDLDTKTIELPRSGIKAYWNEKTPEFFIDQFRDSDGWVYEFNVEIEGSGRFPILHSLGTTFNKIGCELSNIGFEVRKRSFKD